MMPEAIQPWVGDLHEVLSPPVVGLVVTVTAVLCGGIIGLERETAAKPAGLRTLVLICLGAAIFSQASILMADGDADRTRIAAQIVTGIGFLGAGAIFREGRLVVGMTTGAGIWSTAAVGVVIGSGYVVAGIFFTLLIVMTLGAASQIDRFVTGACKHATMRVEFHPNHGKTRLAIQRIVDDYRHPEILGFEEIDESKAAVRIKYCNAHRDHRAFMGELSRIAEITRVLMG